jgi:hypothetical protein
MIVVRVVPALQISIDFTKKPEFRVGAGLDLFPEP